MKMNPATMCLQHQIAFAVGWVLFIAAKVTVAHEGHSHPQQGAQTTPVAEGSPSSATNASAGVQQMNSTHGGKVSATRNYQFEVAFYPKETRIYLNNVNGQPLSAKGVSGEAIMQVRGVARQYRYPVQYLPQQPGSTDQDYLIVQVDTSQLRDGDMQATFDLRNLPDQQEPAAKFVRTFALSHPPLTVVVARLTEADGEGIKRQGTCPVSHDSFDHGDPVKLMIGDRALYVCCEDCIDAVKQHPDVYYAKAQAVAGPRPAQTVPPKDSVGPATAADEAAITAQRVCPVSNQPLGAMGTPLRVTINGQTLYVCCKGCVSRVQQDPAKYFAKVKQLQNGR